REAMQDELKALQQRLGITFVFVTHDQGEALSMADRIAVFNEGRVAQVGTPAEVYNTPRTRFVADFVGSSNVLPPAFTKAFGGPEKPASLRPEAIRLVPWDRSPHRGSVRDLRFLGSGTRVAILMPQGEVSALVPAGLPLPSPGDSVGLLLAPNALHVMEDAG
ncbi:MAG: TOBE domain-containing protein, partial [Gemmobacter sp.]